MVTRRALILCAVATTVVAWAGSTPAKKGAGTPAVKAPKLDLGIPTMSALPQTEGLQTVKEKPADDRAKATANEEGCSVVSLLHGTGVVRTAEGARFKIAASSIAANGTPPVLDRFSTAVRVRCPDRRSRQIDVVMLDLRGDTVMEASAALHFAGKEQTDWIVDWDQTALRRAGDLQVLVRVGGQPLGPFPLKVEQRPPASR